MLQTAIGGIDEALWDIKGKHYEAPAYELLSGRARDRVRVYQWVGGETPEAVARAASEAVDDGYRTVKLSPVSKANWIETPAAVGDAVEKVAAVREAVGESIDVCVDFRGRASKAMTKWLAEAVDPHDPAFIEEPVLPEHNAALATIAARTKTPLAGGQRMHSRWEFESLLDTGAIDVVQPNPSHVGGIAEAKPDRRHGRNPRRIRSAELSDRTDRARGERSCRHRRTQRVRPVTGTRRSRPDQ